MEVLGRWLAWVAAVLCVLCAGEMGARAQDGDGGGGGGGGGGEVMLNVTGRGIGGKVRPGHWAAFEVEITDTSPEIRTVIVRLEVPDLDGDTGYHERTITTKPGAKLRLWLYARIPFAADNLYTVRALEAIERDEGVGDAVTYIAGRELGIKPFNLRGLMSDYAGLIGIVGRREAGLDQYSYRMGNEDHPASGHELIEIAGALLPGELPDRWMGLMALEALVWTGTSAEEQPSKLSESQASAIREWVLRGGHLIIVMPQVGQTWVGSESNPLADIMPQVEVQRQEEVDLAPYRWLLTIEEKAALPAKAVVQSFVALTSAGPWDAMPILAGPDGRAVVTRRLVGLGAVTLVGLDVVGLSQLLKALRADMLWHRILGKRHDLTPPAELSKFGNDPNGPQLHFGSRDDAWFDEVIAPTINKQSRAAAGLLLALVVFGAFWLLAGPMGFFLLKKRNLVQHSWVVFMLVIGLFTGIAWTGATALRQTSADGLHYTLLDHVYGQPVQRARSWMNIYLPRYGDVRVSVEGGGRADARLHQALAAWDPPRSSGGAGSFPDARGYEVDARNPDTILFPARSTVKAVQIDWAGAPRWKMPLPVLPEGGEGGPPALGSEMRLTYPNVPGVRGFELTGMLKHELPGALEDVVVVVVRRQMDVRLLASQRQLQGTALVQAHAYTRPDSWRPGEVWDLSQLSVAGEGTVKRDTGKDARLYFDQTLTPRSSSYGTAITGRAGGISDDAAAKAVAFYSMLKPKDLGDRNDPTGVARRDASHGYDLGRWFTQPCVIIVGTLSAECPVPVTVDGRAVPTKGKTVVRWVYPLPADPPAYGSAPASADDAGPKPEEGG